MDSADPVIHEALRWLRYSSEDLVVASELMRMTLPAMRHICLLSQQAAEKALKAALVYNRIDIKLTHDLDALRNMLPEDWLIRQTHDDLSDLTQWAVEARYPGDWAESTWEDATKAVSEAQSVYDSITTELLNRGILI